MNEHDNDNALSNAFYSTDVDLRVILKTVLTCLTLKAKRTIEGKSDVHYPQENSCGY